MLAGNVTALLSPALFIPLLTLAFRPHHYDWASMRAIRKADDHDLAAAAHVDLERIPGNTTPADTDAEEMRKLKRASRIARALTVFMTLSFLVLWPMPMYGSGYVFSRGFFTGWVVVGILWLFCSAACVGVYPLWEGRGTVGRTAGAVWRDLRGGKGKRGGEVVVVEGVVEGGKGSGEVTPGSGEKR